MYKNILVPLDGSELSECSLRHTQEIARGCHVPEVTFLTVVEEPDIFPSEAGSESQIKAIYEEREQMQKQAMESAKKYLAKASKSLGEGESKPRTIIIQATRPKGVADIILDYAKDNGVDLIVMSTHGRSGISRWAMGSVADRVVRSSLVPVLIVAPSGCRL